MGLIIVLLSGALVSIQGVFNTEVTKQTSVWVAAGWIQLTVFITCMVIWMLTGRGPVAGIVQVTPKYVLVGGIMGALIIHMVIQSMGSLGPIKAALLIMISQIIIAYAIELFGLSDVEKAPSAWNRIIGAVIAIDGIVIFERQNLETNACNCRGSPIEQEYRLGRCSPEGGIPPKMKFTLLKALKLVVIVICMLVAGICYSCGVKNRDIGPESLVMVLEPDGGTIVEESAGIESPRQWDEPGGGAGTMSAGADGEHLRGQDYMPGQEDVPSQAGRLSEGDMLPREDMPLVYIHVCSLVYTPGVYVLPIGSRIYEAIEAAGGFSEAAVPGYLNLARVLEDGMKIQVPDREQAEEWRAQGLTQSGISAGTVSAGVQTPSGTGTGEGGTKAMVNLNTASEEELMTLGGIGKSRAEDIIRYRGVFGGFRSIEDIMNVSGIRDAAFEEIKDSITV